MYIQTIFYIVTYNFFPSIIIIIIINVSIMYIFDDDSGHSGMLTLFLMVLLTETS